MKTLNEQLTSAYAGRFGPQDEPEQSGWSFLGDWICRLILAALFVAGPYVYILAP